jgi:hypothetical protein
MLTAPEADRPTNVLDFRMALRPVEAGPELDAVENRHRALSRISATVLGLLLLVTLVAAVVLTSALLGAGWSLLGWD